MPPTSNAVSASSKSKTNRFSTSPDSEPAQSEPVQQVSSKKKKKNAAARQTQNGSNDDQIQNSEIARPDTPPAARPQSILGQLGRGFPVSSGGPSPLLDVQDDEVVTTGKVSDQYTPPNDTWIEQSMRGKPQPVEPAVRVRESTSPPAEPGFSTRVRYESKSPPISPPTRHSRPISYGGGMPPVPTLPRASPSTYGYSPTAYGSPPAPHLPQPHFYHAQDINLGLPRSIPHVREEPSLIGYTKLPTSAAPSGQGIFLGFEGRLHFLRAEGATITEIGSLESLSGTVVDAAFLEWHAGPDPFAALRPLVAVVIHGPREVQAELRDQPIQEETRPNTRPPMLQQGLEYTTRVEVFSMSTQERLVILLETSGQMPQSSFRGASPTPPGPIGCLKLQSSGSFLTVSSGISGEVFAFSASDYPQPSFECLGKFWTTIQPQTQRRDSSHHRSSDVDTSPADLGRAVGGPERAVTSLNGRWLAISPATSPSRPSLGAMVGRNVTFGRHSGTEATSAPARPSLTCEVDSPDVDTIFGKVARGVAQELVKGAKWLGDQGYQTWQSYWRKDQSPSGSGGSSAYTSPPLQPVLYTPNAFPPTHGETTRNAKEPDLVAIYDLQALLDPLKRKASDECKPFATFQPPGGCSFVSFAPHGINLLTASRKGDVQYIWDMMQVKHCRAQTSSVDDDRVREHPRVRQIARYERLSGTTIVDVVWQLPIGSRFAVLTKNKTIHLFDLPASAFKWPPPRRPRKGRPVSHSSDSMQNDGVTSGSFFASAMNIATQAQPMISGWRGRAPSLSGGLAGIGQTGIGLASATGARGGKAVAAGLSKSLGAASETVHHIRYVGSNRLHLKTTKAPVSGKVSWIQIGRKSFLTILETDSIKQYQVRQNKTQDKREKDDVTVFAAHKAAVVMLPSLSRLPDEELSPNRNTTEFLDQRPVAAYWNFGPITTSTPQRVAHPLSFAEIETNAPYQPFHSDRRVNLSVYSHTGMNLDRRPLTSSVLLHPQPQSKDVKPQHSLLETKWTFGDDILTTTLNISKVQVPDEDSDNVGSVIYRKTVQVSSPTADEQGMDQIVSTTRRRQVKRGRSTLHDVGSDVEKEDGFFEDDCDVLDFATDRV